MPPMSRITNMFPFSEPARDSMQRDVVSIIRRADFIFALPELSPASWSLIINNPAERERLEFLGDALIGAAISEELLRCWPNEGPGFYTMTRAVLTANSTFAHLMCKVGLHAIGNPVKPAGDAFETMLAAFHSEMGQAVFNQYVRRYFTPLMSCCTASYHNNRFAAQKARVKKQMHVQRSNATTTMLGNMKSRRSLKQRAPRPKKKIRQDPLPDQYRVPMSQIPPIDHRNPLIPNAKFFKEPHVIVDLTSDSDEEPSVVRNELGLNNKPVFLNNKPGSSTMTTSSTSANNKAMPTSYLPPRPCLEVTKEVTSHDILQSIRVAPKQEKIIGLFLAKQEPGAHDWIPEFSHTSVNRGQLGSMSNPITLD